LGRAKAPHSRHVATRIVVVEQARRREAAPALILMAPRVPWLACASSL
jgi:hypothetical protein